MPRRLTSQGREARSKRWKRELEQRKAEAEATRLALKDRSKIKAEIESWVSKCLEKRLEDRSIHLGNITLEELRECVLSDDYLYSVEVEFKSGANIQYRVTHAGRTSFIILKQFGKQDVKDFKNVMGIIARETKGKLERGGIQIYPQGKLTKLRIADFIEKYKKHFSDVKIERAYFTPVLFEKDARAREYVNRNVAKWILESIDDYLSEIAEDGIETTCERYFEGYAGAESGIQSVHEPPLWIQIMFDLWELGCDDEEAEREMRKVKELFKQVLEERGLLRPTNVLKRG